MRALKGSQEGREMKREGEREKGEVEAEERVNSAALDW